MAVRFAPSPTGELHLGHAYSALLNWHHAQETGVPFLLRHEDIDATRVRPHFYDWIEEDLAWLGLDWPKPARRQSDHIDDYRDRLVALAEMGVVYPCAKTRKDVALAADSAPQAGHEGAAPLLDRPSDQDIADTLGSGVSFAWRFDPRVAKDLVGSKSLTYNEHGAGGKNVDPFRLGSVVLGRKDAAASYHICVVHDDALQDVSTVIRGEDLADSTHLHVVLQTLLGLPTPAYRHHRLITDPTGKRLAKRDDATSLRTLRANGVTPEDIAALVGLDVAG
jgi:glutamyl-Q tRNA(Asp) synthetase